MKGNAVILIIAMLFVVGAGMPARGDFAAGRSAYLLGDYAGAMKEFKGDNSPEGCYRVGYMYDHGEGVPQDGQAAAEWYRKAADQGYVLAQYRLGLSYSTGYGVEQDLKVAEKWYKKAAAQGFLPAKEALMNLKNGK